MARPFFIKVLRNIFTRPTLKWNSIPEYGARGCVFRAAFISNRGRKNLRDEIFPILSSPLAHLARDRTAPDNQMTEEILHGSPQCALFDIDTIRGGRLKRKIVK